MSKQSIFLLAGLVVLATLLVTLMLDWGPLESQKEAAYEPKVSPIDGSLATGEELPEQSINDADTYPKSTGEQSATGATAENDFTEPYSTTLLQSDSVTDFLSDASETFGWTERQQRWNHHLWKDSCEQARTMATASGNVAIEDGFAKLLQRDAQALSDYCSNLVNDAELMSLDMLEAHYDGDQSPSSELQEFRSDLEGRTPTDQDLERAMDLLDHFITVLDESGVQSVLSTVVGQQLYTSEALSDPEFQIIGLGLVSDVATSVICNRGGGCQGGDHPVVLRYCFQQFSRGELCSNPASLSEAIFQTTSPNRYRWFSTFQGYVESQLRQR
jgi:hypothetical protein